MGAYFELFVGKDEQYYFNLVAPNHEIILSSEGYVKKGGAENGIASVRENSSLPERYVRRNSIDQKFYFVLNAANGQTIGVSEVYNSKAARENGIRSVMDNGQTATVKEVEKAV